jgi:hypothetical protein
VLLRGTCFDATTGVSLMHLKNCKQVTHFEIAQLSKLLPAVVKFACEGLNLLVDDLVSAYIAALCKGLATDVATVGTLACVSSLVGL